MKPQQYEIWLADLNPQFGTEPGKKRPVVILQTDLLNQTYPSTIICPVTTNVNLAANILRVHLSRGEAGVNTDCDIMIDQLRAIDNHRFVHRIGSLSHSRINEILTNLKIILDL